MTDPRDLLSGPPRYLPPELADLLRGLLGNVGDSDLRRALRKFGEACFDAGYALGIDDPTPDEDRRQPSTGYSYSVAAVHHDTGSPTYDRLHRGSERVSIP